MTRCAALAALLVLAGCAGDKATPTTDAPPPRQLAQFGAAAGAPPADPAPLTKDQLHACLSESRQVHEASPGTQSAQGDLQARKAALDARKDDLQAQKPAKGSDNAVIAAYNKKVAALNADYAALSRDDKANSARVGGVNGVASKFNAECSGRSFYTDDFDSMLPEFPDAQL